VSAISLSTCDELVSVDPATLAEVGRVPVTEPAAMGEIVAEARIAQRDWAREPFEVRSRLLRRVAHALLESAEAVAGTVVRETGKPVVEAYTSELFVCLDNLTWLASNLGRVLRRERLPVRQPHLLHKRAWLRLEPAGVVGIVSAWNFPLGVPLTQAATAVAAGNAVVLKPSELTPLTGRLIEELFRRAGAPPGLVCVAQGPGDTVGDALVRQRGVDKLVFTGSADVGRAVAARAAERLCPVTLELGGKDPMLVLDDADLDRAIAGALWASFANCGQICSGVERIYVARALHEPFVAGLAERAGRLRIGRGDDPATDLGPLVTEGQRAGVEELVADAVACGAEIVAGGGRPDVGLPGWFHEPTVLAGEPMAARIRSREIFGPVVTVVSIDDDEDGIRRANDSAHGLGASVWTQSRTRARRVAERVEAGSVWVNDHAYSYGLGQAPWGGWKESGIGRTHARQGLHDLSRLKYVDADGGRLSPPWWYPYSDMVVDGFRGALGVLYGDGVVARAGAVRRHRRGLAELGKRALRG
jgi:succinate-semialdehyde dehydrogenase/glutarate-semialdehyde dehydrogenase